MDITLKRDKYHMGGHSLRLSTRYDVSRLWSAGIGIGLDRYTEPDYNTMPVFATVRYKALEKVPDAYVFADMGYSIKSGDFTKGLTGSLGIGYTHMFADVRLLLAGAIINVKAGILLHTQKDPPIQDCAKCCRPKAVRRTRTVRRKRNAATDIASSATCAPKTPIAALTNGAVKTVTAS